MSRPVFSFRPNMEDVDHRRAWEALQSVPAGQKNRFLVQSILNMQDEQRLEELVRRAVREELNSGEWTHLDRKQQEEIPTQMLDFLSQIGTD